MEIEQGTPAIDGDRHTMWIFEPLAEQIFESWVKENQLEHSETSGWTGKGLRWKRADRPPPPVGDRFEGEMFLDCTYEEI